MKLAGVVEYWMEYFGLNFHNDWLSGCEATAIFPIHPKLYVDSESWKNRLQKVDKWNDFNSLKFKDILMKLGESLETRMRSTGLNFYKDWLRGLWVGAIVGVYPKILGKHRQTL